jgi:hypothetical protein
MYFIHTCNEDSHSTVCDDRGISGENEFPDQDSIPGTGPDLIRFFHEKRLWITKIHYSGAAIL